MAQNHPFRYSTHDSLLIGRNADGPALSNSSAQDFPMSKYGSTGPLYSMEIQSFNSKNGGQRVLLSPSETAKAVQVRALAEVADDNIG